MSIESDSCCFTYIGYAYTTIGKFSQKDYFITAFLNWVLLVVFILLEAGYKMADCPGLVPSNTVGELSAVQLKELLHLRNQEIYSWQSLMLTNQSQHRNEDFGILSHIHDRLLNFAVGVLAYLGTMVNQEIKPLPKSLPDACRVVP